MICSLALADPCTAPLPRALVDLVERGCSEVLCKICKEVRRQDRAGVRVERGGAATSLRGALGDGGCDCRDDLLGAAADDVASEPKFNDAPELQRLGLGQSV